MTRVSYYYEREQFDQFISRFFKNAPLSKEVSLVFAEIYSKILRADFARGQVIISTDFRTIKRNIWTCDKNGRMTEWSMSLTRWVDKGENCISAYNSITKETWEMIWKA